MSWLRRLIGGKGSTIAEPDFSGGLPAEPAQIAQQFVADYERWNTYAWSAYQSDSYDERPQRSYLELIAHYCGPAKKPQLPAFGTVSTFSAENCSIGSARADGGKCTVPVTAPDQTGFDAAFEFDFVRDGDRWWLEEVYYLDEYENNARLRYL